jgi:Tfp pilus assembly protein PilV
MQNLSKMKGATDNRCGFSLVEVTLALGVASVCLITIFGLLPVGMQTNQDAFQQVTAADILGAAITDLRAVPVTIPRGEATTSQQFGISIPANPLSGAVISTLFFTKEGRASWSRDSQARYRLTITFQPNAGSRTATRVHLKMTWPAEVLPANATGFADVFLALDRN